MNIPSAGKFHKKMKFFCVRIFTGRTSFIPLKNKRMMKVKNKFPSPEKRWGFGIVAASEFHSPPQDLIPRENCLYHHGNDFVRQPCPRVPVPDRRRGLDPSQGIKTFSLIFHLISFITNKIRDSDNHFLNDEKKSFYPISTGQDFANSHCPDFSLPQNIRDMFMQNLGLSGNEVPGRKAHFSDKQDHVSCHSPGNFCSSVEHINKVSVPKGITGFPGRNNEISAF